MSFLALVNAYLRFYNDYSFFPGSNKVGSSFLFAGYLGMFVGLAISPIPDYILVPVYGYLSAVGIFNPYTTFIVCLVGAVFPLEYVCGRFAGRPLLLKGLSYLRISETDITVGENWLKHHGSFSIFISTFIPFFYTVASLAAGTLKMSWASFMVYSAVGFGLRYVFLEYIGYFGIYIFAASFDYAERGLFFFLIVLPSAYAIAYLVSLF